MIASINRIFLKTLLMAVTSIMLVACLPDQQAAVTEDVFVSGSVGDGPVTGATVTVTSSKGRKVKSVLSDSTATFSSRMKVRRSEYPLTLSVSGGIDLVTGAEPDFRMYSVMLDRDARRVQINPFSTLIVLLAGQLPGGLGTDNVVTARRIVSSGFSFGLDPEQMPDPVNSALSNDNIAGLIKSSEALGETIRRTRDALSAYGRAVNGDDIMQALAADLVDGRLDGRGGKAADQQIALTATVVSAQVLVEAMANDLRVNDVVATVVLDQAIVTTNTGIDATLLTEHVPVTAGLLNQARAALDVARTLDGAVALAQLGDTIDLVRPGSLAAQVRPVLPDNAARLLDAAISSAASGIPAVVADATLLTEPVTQEPVTQEPVTQEPVTQEPVTQEPVAAEPVADTGAATGTGETTQSSVDSTTSDPVAPVDPVVNPDPVPVVEVSGDPVVDGASEPPLADTVQEVPVNHAPQISGTPAMTVVAGDAYYFQPTVTDADGDTLVFGIDARPVWASFDTRTGVLSGTPADAYAGNYRDILITVSDGVDSSRLAPFSIAVLAPASVAPAPLTGDMTLSWTAPSARTDGAPMSLAEISGYRIRYGMSPGHYDHTVDIADGSQQSTTLAGLPGGTYYVVMSTYDTADLEGPNSPEVVKVVN